MKPSNHSQLDVAWNRAHFGGWCIISAPLIIGGALDLSSPKPAASPATLDAVMPILTNPHAIEVNQQWAGSPGMLLMSFDPENPNPPDEAGYLKLVGALGPGLCNTVPTLSFYVSAFSANCLFPFCQRSLTEVVLCASPPLISLALSLFSVSLARSLWLCAACCLRAFQTC